MGIKVYYEIVLAGEARGVRGVQDAVGVLGEVHLALGYPWGGSCGVWDWEWGQE